MAAENGKNKIRYAAVGLGWIVQEDVLPAFVNTNNSDCVLNNKEPEPDAILLG